MKGLEDKRKAGPWKKGGDRMKRVEETEEGEGGGKQNALRTCMKLSKNFDQYKKENEA